MPKEIILNEKEPWGFSKTLVLLNERFAILKNGQKNPQVLLFLKQCLDKDPSKAYKAFDKLIQYRSIIPLLSQHNPRDNITNPFEIFKFYNLQPYIGEKSEGKKFADKDFVIGLEVECENLIIKYRLDYDPEKKLHLNLDFYEVTLKSGKKISVELKHKFAIFLKNSTGRFGFSAVPEDNVELKQQTSQAIKFKFWLKMSMAYYYSSNKLTIDQSQANNNQDKLATQFLQFIKGKPHNFEGFKHFIIPTLQDQNAIDIVEKCLDDKSLVTVYQTQAGIRHSITDIFVKQQTNTSIAPSTVVDSEKFTLSDEPPAGQYL